MGLYTFIVEYTIVYNIQLFSLFRFALLGWSLKSFKSNDGKTSSTLTLANQWTKETITLLRDDKAQKEI